MYVLFLPSHFCSSHIRLQSVCSNLYRNMHRPSSSLTSSPSASPNSVCTFPRLYLRKGQVAHSAILCYFLNTRRVQKSTNRNLITQYVTNSDRPILHYTYLSQYVIYFCLPWVISTIYTCFKIIVRSNILFLIDLYKSVSVAQIIRCTL
jgi:hypothetical protein